MSFPSARAPRTRSNEPSARLKEAHPDATWRPYSGGDRELRSQPDVRAFLDDLTAEGRVVDPRAYAVEPRGKGLIVMGTLGIWGPDGLSETEVHWMFCFRGVKVSIVAGFDQRDEAVRAIRELCPH